MSNDFKTKIYNKIYLRVKYIISILKAINIVNVTERFKLWINKDDP